MTTLPPSTPRSSARPAGCPDTISHTAPTTSTNTAHAVSTARHRPSSSGIITLFVNDSAVTLPSAGPVT